MLRMTPYFFPKERFGGRSMPAKLTAVEICFSGSLGRSSVRAPALSSFPACRHVLPCPCRQSPALFHLARCPSSAVCGNPRPHARGAAIPAFLFGRRLHPRALPRFSLRRAPALSNPPWFVLPAGRTNQATQPTHARRASEYVA